MCLAPIVGAFAAGMILDEKHYATLRTENQRSLEDCVRRVTSRSYILRHDGFSGRSSTLPRTAHTGCWHHDCGNHWGSVQVFRPVCQLQCFPVIPRQPWTPRRQLRG